MSISSGSPTIEARLKKGRKTLWINVRLFESKDKAISELGQFFYMRSIMPRTREMPLIGDKSLTAETAERVEISFVKENVAIPVSILIMILASFSNSPTYNFVLTISTSAIPVLYTILMHNY